MCQISPVINLSENTAEAMRQHVLEQIEKSIQVHEEQLKAYERQSQTGDYYARSSLNARCAAEKATLDVLRDQRVYLKRATFSVIFPKRDCDEIYT